MYSDDPDRPVGAGWRISVGPRSPVKYVTPDVGAGLQWLSSKGVWATGGEEAGFMVHVDALGHSLAAGWYELRVRLLPERGRVVLPSIRAHYVPHSALTDLEVVLPKPDQSGRVRMLLLFLEDVQSLTFVPSIAPAQFVMRDFSLCRVSRLRALLMMLGGPAGMRPGSLIARSIAWVRKAVRHGPRRAADQLYADYGKLLCSSGAGEYETWIRKYDTIGPAALEGFKQRARMLDGRGPLISALLCVDAASPAQLRRCLDSVIGQAWERWELCVTPAASLAPSIAQMLAEYAARDARIRVVESTSDAPNAALTAVRGDFVALLDADGELRPHALLYMAEAVAADRDIAMLYSDEDSIADDGRRHDHCFKPDWDPDLLRSRDYVGHLAMVRATLAREAGGFRDGFGDGRGYDLILRCSERVAARRIRHIPAILYHRLAALPMAVSIGDPDTAGAARLRAVADHLQRIGSAARVEAVEGSSSLRVHWRLPQQAPRVSLIVPTRDRAELLRTCVESILAKTTYPDFELLVVDNQSSERAALEYLHQLASRERVRVLRYNEPFNYSALNNWAVRQCSGQLIGMVNNDIEVISPDWLVEMAALAARPDTGVVGAMLYYPDDTIQHAGMVLGLFGFAGHVYAGKPRGHDGYHGRARAVQSLSAVTGACLLVRRDVYESVGGLDESLPVEFNDVDFCLRVRQCGYRNVWTPHAELYHHESASRSVDGATPRKARFAEVALMQARWGGLLQADPAYNPNLSLQGRDFELAFPPRRPGKAGQCIGYDGA